MASLRDRVFVSSSWGKGAETVPTTSRSYVPLRPVQYKSWTEENMSRAISAVVQDGVAIRKAAELYNVPKSTLGDRITGRVLPGSKSGPATYLTAQEEKELTTFLCRSAAIGYGRTRSEVMAIVERILSSRGIYKKVSSGWWESFVKRNPQIVLRSPAALSNVRAMASDRDSLDKYFDILEDAMEENCLTDAPLQIFNMDETGLALDPKSMKTVNLKGSKNPSTITSGSKQQITIVGCVRADGQSLPPMVIWNRKKLPAELSNGEVPGTIYGLSEKGWIDRELFYLWFRKLFLNYAPACRPLLLLVDGHSSHYCPEAIRYAAEQQIIIFTFPPNTTHLTQPLDKGMFGLLKIAWREAIHDYLIKNPGRVISKHNFSDIFSGAWLKAMTPKNILAGFRTTGVYPLNRDTIELPGDDVTSNLCQKTGLPYIPLYTPVKRRISDGVVESPKFSQSELLKFEQYYDDEQDCDDPRYKLWLTKYHPELPLLQESPFQPRYQQAERHNTLSPFLTLPDPPRHHASTQSHSSRVLTSAENLRALQEKEMQKEERERLKQERIRNREAKKQQKVQLKASKKENIHKPQPEEAPYSSYINDDYLFDDDYWDIPEHLFDSEEEEKAQTPKHAREKEILDAKKGHPQSDHELEKQSSTAKRQENQQSKSKSMGTNLKATRTSQRKQDLKVTCDSTRQTRSSTKYENKVLPDALNKKIAKKGNTVHANTSSTTPRQTHSSQRSRQESNEHALAAVVIGPGSKKKEPKKSYSMRQRAAVIPETSAGSKKDETDVTDPKASGKEKEVVKKVYATRQKTVISESGSSTDISQKGNNKIEGVTVPGDKVSKKKKEVSSTHPKTAILELPSSDTDSQNGKSEMEGATIPGDRASKKVVKKSSRRQKIAELPSSDTDSQNGKSEMEGATIPGDRASKKVVKKSSRRQKIAELPSSDTDSQNGKSEMEGATIPGDRASKKVVKKSSRRQKIAELPSSDTDSQNGKSEMEGATIPGDRASKKVVKKSSRRQKIAELPSSDTDSQNGKSEMEGATIPGDRASKKVVKKSSRHQKIAELPSSDTDSQNSKNEMEGVTVPGDKVSKKKKKVVKNSSTSSKMAVPGSTSSTKDSQNGKNPVEGVIIPRNQKKKTVAARQKTAVESKETKVPRDKDDGDVIEINEDATTPEHLGTKWWIKDLQLALSDRNALLSGKDLTEAIMNAVQMLLHHQFPRVKGLQDTGLSRFLSFSTTKRNAVQIFHVELQSHGHWVCTATVDSPTEVKLFDSVGSFTVIEISLLLQIAKVYSPGGILKVRKENVQQQVGHTDCGCFAIAFAIEVCQGRNPCTASFNQELMRVHLYKCLQRGEMSAFPQMPKASETIPRPKSQLFTYPINCYCGMPDEYDTDMIQCDSCNKWVHYACAGICKATTDFSCSVCMGNGRQVAGKPKEFSVKYPAKKGNK